MNEDSSNILKRLKILTLVVLITILVTGISIVAYSQPQAKANPNSNKQVINESYEPVKYSVNDYQPRVYPWQDAGYSSVCDYNSALFTKRAEASGMADKAIGSYSEVITEDQINILRNCENEMFKAPSISLYDKYLEEFNTVTAECETALAAIQPVYSTNYDDSSYYAEPYYYEASAYSYTPSYSGDPYNFRSAGVLQDGQYRYTYYSSNVLRHYRTDEWNLGSDGIYRDDSGRVIVASDEYAQGTVVNSDIFGECVVSDTGVGASGTLDVYTGF